MILNILFIVFYQLIYQLYQMISKMNLGLLRYRFSTAQATIHLGNIPSFKLDLQKHPLPTVAITNKDQCLKYYREMEIMRKMEQACDVLYKKKEIRGFCHLYTGQEAVAEGLEASLTFDDPLIGAYRIHCQAYKRGFTVRQIIAEMLGKGTGATMGKGGSMHYYNKKTNFYGGNGIVGAQVPVGAGLAFALKYQNKKNVAITQFGDGAANQGQLFEAANMAYLWKLPLILFCQNNHYGMGTSIERSSMNPQFYTRGDVIPGIQVDGNSIFDMREATKWAKQYCIENGPLFMQVKTYRYHGHSMSDPGLTYRTREQVQESRKNRDPITRLRNIMVENKYATVQELDKIEQQIKEYVNNEAQLAKQDPVVDVKELTNHTYTDNANHYIRGILYEDSYIPPSQKY